jgi:hypothetical protein
VYCLSTGAKTVLPKMVATVLGQCNAFAQLRTHAREICSHLRLPLEQIPVIRNILHDLVQENLLISDESIVRRSREKSFGAATTSEIALLGVLTSKRPQCLERCLESYGENAKRFARRLTTIVVDGSGDESIENQNEAAITRAKRKTGLPVLHFTNRQKTDLINLLVAEGLDVGTVTFALCGVPEARVLTGSNRNVLSLLTAGSQTVSIDDDTMCSLVSPRLPETGALSLSSSFNPTSIEFFNDREQLHHLLEPNELIDFIECHGRALGRTLPSFLSQFEKFSCTNGSAISSDLMLMLENGFGVVLTTQGGIAGDCGFGSPSGYLTAGGATRRRLLQSEAVYDSACSSREVLAMVSAITLTDSEFLMAGAIGLDNRTGLCPFFPVCRGQDGLFGVVLRKCFSNSLGCHLPIAVLHTPPVRRRFDPDAIWKDGARFEMSSLMVLLVGALQFSPSDREHTTRLRLLGNHLEGLSRLSDSDFSDNLHQLALTATIRKIASLEELCRSDPNAPQFWIRDLKRYVHALKTSVQSDLFFVPQDLSFVCRECEIISEVKLLVGRYGALLRSWPDMVAIAQKKREECLLR